MVAAVLRAQLNVMDVHETVVRAAPRRRGSRTKRDAPAFRFVPTSAGPTRRSRNPRERAGGLTMERDGSAVEQRERPQAAKEANRRLASIQAEAAQKTLRAAKALTAAGLPLRDAGKYLGVSRQRVHQLISVRPRPRIGEPI